MSHFVVFLHWDSFELHFISILNNKRTIYFIQHIHSVPCTTRIFSEWGRTIPCQGTQDKEITNIDSFLSNNNPIKEEVLPHFMAEEKKVQISYIICPKSYFFNVQGGKK